MPEINPEVLIVHAIDTEGPLYESLSAKFERIYELFGVADIAPTRENFRRLQAGEIDLGGVEKKIMEVLAGHLVNYNDTWDKIDEMLDELLSEEFRLKRPDSYGGGWKYTWHILDHVGFDYNPRRRDMGYHNIFDHYDERLEAPESKTDSLEWHFHPFSTYAEAHRCATAYFRNDIVFQILARKIIERNWFPSSYRAGFQAERPDSNWFLEQWFPFDISNMAVEDSSELDTMADFRNGRSGNWRNAPADWSIYHPDHDDYQKAGNCRRWVGRALNVMNRMASIDQYEVDKAFSRAQKTGQPVLLGITGHDFRDLRYEVNFVRKLVGEAAEKFPSVKHRYCSVKEGFQRAIWGDDKVIEENALKLKVTLNENPSNDVPNLVVETLNGKVFGPQPFLAIQTKSRLFFNDNFDWIDDKTWGYAFHTDTLPLDDVAHLSVAANDQYGNTVVERIL